MLPAATACVVTPVDQRYDVPLDAVSVTLPPAQNVVGPLAVMVAVGLAVMVTGTVAVVELQPFASVNNLLNQAYIGSVTINGAAGRTIEPAPLRNYYFGMEIGWRAVK